MGETPKLKSTDFLKEVAKHHKEWVRTCKALGGGDFSEDIVQEMYIKLWKYASAEKIIKDGILQKGYVFFALRSVLYALKSEQKLVYKEEINDDLLEDKTDHEEEEAFEKFCGLIDSYLDEREKGKNWYATKVFQIYRETNLSMRKMAKLSNISWVSIFHTLKNVKQDLRNEFQEDWDDYQNGDYDKIR
jgi:DNA-directed RNA polymerase specialized sigma24 family protein